MDNRSDDRFGDFGINSAEDGRPAWTYSGRVDAPVLNNLRIVLEPRIEYRSAVEVAAAEGVSGGGIMFWICFVVML